MGLNNILKGIGRVGFPALFSIVSALSPIKTKAETYSVICGGHKDTIANTAISGSALAFYHALKTHGVNDQNQTLLLNKKNKTTINSGFSPAWDGDDVWEFQDLLTFPTTAQIDYQDNNVTATNFLNAIKNTPTTKEDNLIISFISHSSYESNGYFDLFTGSAGGATWDGVSLDGRNLKAYMLNKALKNKEFNKCYVIGVGCYGNSTLKHLEKDQSLNSSPLENVITVSSTQESEVEGGTYFTKFISHLIRANPNNTVHSLLQQADSLNDPEHMVVHYFGSDPTYLENWTKNHTFWDIDPALVDAIERQPKTLDSYISTYPNPFNKSININYNKNEFPDAKIYNINGKFIENIKNNKFSPNNHPAGIYLAILKNKKSKVTKKINYLK